MRFAQFDIRQFLDTSWQKQPRLIRNPWQHWQNPLEPDELAGLACEEGVEARLITRKGDTLAMERGPLPEERFGELGAEPWTLLVQAVDHYVPDVAALIEPFRFVPDWRIDDVMVSYATDGGGVGPHYDQYDVFLIQGLGRRKWRVGPLCDAQTPLAPHEDLRLLAGFESLEEWVLEPGDILYVPPGFAHDGIAVGDDCMTYSIGFRAPSRAELVEAWCARQADAMAEDDRYADPDLATQPHPGEITGETIERLHKMVLDALADREAFARWFGHYNTLPKYAETDWRPEQAIDRQALQAQLADGAPLERNRAHRFGFIRQDAGLLLFVDGQQIECAGDAATVAEQLCAQPSLTLDPALAGSGAVLDLLATLIDQGSLAFEEQD
ncbi:MAG TPA: cupin domain-containing protein [Novosphingobium sp.]|nr:cupin domain-containing protein [Novosphingobium sp.]